MADRAELSQLHQGSPDEGVVIDLSIVIVSWNVREFLRSCLSSIFDHQGDLLIEVIVVDNASSDGSAQMIRDDYSWVNLVACDENVGFPKGNNIGLRHATGRYQMLLNPDTKIIGDALSKMVDYLAENEGVGIVGGQLLNSDGTIQSSRRRFPSVATAVFESTWFQPYAPNKMMSQYYAEDLPLDSPVEVDWLVGACLMTRREVIDQVGMMDEAYFMYSEELDWCRRIKESGWRIVYLPEAQIIHHVGKSSEQAGTERHVNFQRAKLRYFRKYHGRFATALLRGILLFNYLWQLILEVGKGLIGNRRSLRWQRARAYWRVLRTGLKPAGY